MKKFINFFFKIVGLHHLRNSEPEPIFKDYSTLYVVPSEQFLRHHYLFKRYINNGEYVFKKFKINGSRDISYIGLVKEKEELTFTGFKKRQIRTYFVVADNIKLDDLMQVINTLDAKHQFAEKLVYRSLYIIDGKMLNSRETRTRIAYSDERWKNNIFNLWSISEMHYKP